MLTFIQDFGILFIIIAVVCFLIKLIRQPIIIGYVLSGLFFSLFLTGQTSIGQQIISFSELGITFLLFLMGLEFDFKNLRFLGKDLVIVTFIQSVIFFTAGYVPASLLGFGVKESIYVAILFMFSSTLLVAKWVEDKKESATLHGKIILGILVIQDLFAII